MPDSAAVILAAGRGRRFGGGKLLAPIGGRPMLQHVLDLAAAVSLSPVVVVLGHASSALERALEWHREIRILNPHPEEGISCSLRVGLSALAGSDTGRVLILLGDQPRLTREQVSTILAVARDPERPIVVPRFGGRPGNPVLLERPSWPLAAALQGDRGMSQLFARRADLVRYIDLPGANPDIDTPADLAAITLSGEPARCGRKAAAGRSTP